MTAFALSLRRHQLVAFFGLAFAGFWAALPLAAVSPTVPVFIATFVPATAALLVTAAVDGRAGVRALLAKVGVCRLGAGWYAAAVGLPALVGLGAIAVATALGDQSAREFGAFSVMSLLYFAFAFGEELGWRGYALPRLLERNTPIVAGLRLGAIWFVWHLPLFLPGMLFAGVPVVATGAVFLALSVVYTWLYLHTRGSVLIASLLHGATNAFGVLYAGIELAQGRWLQAAGYGVVVLFIVVVYGPGLGQVTARRDHRMEAPATSHP
jgi:membrane protease YdiL (CAAX protease family)